MVEKMKKAWLFIGSKRGINNILILSNQGKDGIFLSRYTIDLNMNTFLICAI